MLPKWVYTAIVDVPTSVAMRRAVTACGPSSASTLAADSMSDMATSVLRGRGT